MNFPLRTTACRIQGSSEDSWQADLQPCIVGKASLHQAKQACI